MQSSGRLKPWPELSGSLEQEWGIAAGWAELALVGSWEQSSELKLLGVQTVPAFGVGLVHHGSLGLDIGLGFGLSIHTLYWSKPELGWLVGVEPGLKLRAGLEWHWLRCQIGSFISLYGADFELAVGRAW
jgi:hypothetical protein